MEGKLYCPKDHGLNLNSLINCFIFFDFYLTQHLQHFISFYHLKLSSNFAIVQYF